MLSLIIITQSIIIYLVTNPILSILCLMSVYILVAIYFFILGAEFLSIVLIIVYVGAVSILFIFVIMMLNVRLLNLYYNVSVYYIPFSLFLGFITFSLFSYFIFFDVSFIDYYYNDDNFIILFLELI